VMKDLFGRALLDYHERKFKAPLLLHNEYGEPEEIPVESYFRDFDTYTELEVFALEQISGSALDVGSASGRHPLFLQERGIDITAMDISPLCGELMKRRGVANIIISDVLKFKTNQFDTVFLLMNGIGIAGSLEGLHVLLRHLKTLVKQNGQIILDSSDISYLYDDHQQPRNKYFGQLSFRYEYDGQLDDQFDWLYIDQQNLIELSRACEWNCQIIFQDDTDAYLARLTHN